MTTERKGEPGEPGEPGAPEGAGGAGGTGGTGGTGEKGERGFSAKSGDIPRWILILLALTVPAYLVLAGSVVLAFRPQSNEEEARARADRRITSERVVEACEDRNETKEAIRALLSAALDDGNPVGDLTRVPGFEELDPETQIYLRNVSSSGGDSPSTSDRLAAFRATLIDEDCPALGEAIRRDLEEAR